MGFLFPPSMKHKLESAADIEPGTLTKLPHESIAPLALGTSVLPIRPIKHIGYGIAQTSVCRNPQGKLGLLSSLESDRETP